MKANQIIYFKGLVSFRSSVSQKLWASHMAQWQRACLPVQETQVQSLGWEEPWRRKWQPAPVFLPGKSHGQRNLVGYSPWGHKRVRHDLATIDNSKVKSWPD